LHTGGVTRSSPVIDRDGNIYLAASQRNLSVGSNGKMRWNWTDPLMIEETPAVAANGLIYFSAPWEQLFAFQENGAVKWQVGFAGPIVASPAIGADGTIYVSDHMTLYAVNSTNSLAPLAKSSWPMFRANPRHTGRVNVN
jgi:outer membrane protein assembly factor BamB